MVKNIWKFQNVFASDSKKRNYYIVYTVSFLILAFFVFSWYIFSGRSLIRLTDGWNQHFKALVYYSKYLRQIIRDLLFNHQLVIPDWDFYIGEGSDIVNALHYYVIGDPIALFSVFVPTRYMHYFFSFSCIMRLYLAGIAFSALAFETGLKNRYGILAGALSYSFCYWALFIAPRHPFFLNPMIYFPFLILGIEKILRKERPYVFILSVAISAASNFYFFYMIVILAVIYVLIRLGFLYRGDLKNDILTLLKLGGAAVIGVSMAGIILLPVLTMFLQDSRMSVSQPFHWLYPLQYYSQLPATTVADNYPYYLCMGFTAPVIIALFVFFIRRRENRFLKALFGGCTIITLFPIFGRILNGMAGETNRWSWAFALLCSYILAKEWDTLISLRRSDWRKVFYCSIAFYTVCLLFDKSRTAVAFSVIPLFFITLILVRDEFPDRKNRWQRQVFLLLIVGVSAINLAFWKYSPDAGNYVEEFKENREIQEELFNTEAEIVKALSDVSYPRYTGAITQNANMINKISSTQYYWSLSNPYVSRFRSDMEMRESHVHLYQGYDDRTSLIALAAVRYYVGSSGGEAGMPYGYTLLDTVNLQEVSQQEALDALRQELGSDELTEAQEAKITSALTSNYAVYKNNYALPLGYCYSAYITEETWESLDAVQKQEIQLEAAYVNERPDGIAEYTGNVSDYSIPYEVECLVNDIVETETGFIATLDSAPVVLSFQGVENSETYICFRGLGFEATSEYDLYLDDETVDPLNLYNQTNWNLLTRDQQISIRKAKLYWQDTAEADIALQSSAKKSKVLAYRPFASGRHDYIVNLGYFETPITSVRINFPARGRYTFEDLQVYNVPMDRYAEKISALQENTLQNIELGTDKISGELNIDRPLLLCMAVSYSSGWKAFVDGEETPVMVTNDRYLGISVPSGSHAIEFHYSRPYKHIGLAVSLAGIVALITTVALTEKRCRTRKV